MAPVRAELSRRTTDAMRPAIGALLFLAAFAIFELSPVDHRYSDPCYTLLLSESLLQRRTATLEAYGFSHPPPEYYQLTRIRDHTYYLYSMGSSILSIPFVAVLNAFGVTPFGPDGRYSVDREGREQKLIASFLMATFVLVVYQTSRLVLPPAPSLWIATATALGTPVWSSASRALWSHTWGLVLVGCAVLMLLSASVRKREPTTTETVVLGTLLAWAYFVRSMNVLAVGTCALYLAIAGWRTVLVYVATCAVWVLLFALQSWLTLGSLMRPYDSLNLLYFSLHNFGQRLAGVLISPSRGLFIFSPILLIPIYLVLRYPRYLKHRALVGLATLTAAANVLTVATFEIWYAGHSFGPRLLSDSLPWFVIMTIFGVEAFRQARSEDASHASSPGRAILLTIAGILFAVSVFINGRGATSEATDQWNKQPVALEMKTHRERVWDWKDPQFMRGIAWWADLWHGTGIRRGTPNLDRPASP